MTELVRRARQGLAAMVEELAVLVAAESPSADAAATAACGDLVDDLLRRRLGVGPAERVVSGGRTHLRWRFGTPRVLVLGHVDTVWPHGTVARWPFSVDGDRATGPGCFDMKAGIVQAVAALGLVESLDGVAVLLTADEEVGSPTSAELVVETAGGCQAVLVCEPSADAAVKTARKGVALYQLEVAGRAAHAGLEPERGANAGVALAHAVIAAAALTDQHTGTTVTPTVLSAGTTGNTVPAAARAAVDVRATSAEELQRVGAGLDAAAAAAQAAVAGTSVTATGGVNRPPLDAASSRGLFLRAQRLAETLGLPPLQGAAVGGGSDGNFTAGAGVPTLDGLGAVGGGAHAEGEHVLLPAMAERAALLAALLDELRRPDGGEPT